MRKIVSFIPLSLITSMVIAAPLSSTVKLDGGTINPASQLNIGLEKIANGAVYNITCDIIDLNNKANQVIMSVHGGGSVTFSNIRLNGNEQNQQFKLDQVNNKLELVNVLVNAYGPSPVITFKNIDRDDAVTADNCVAVSK